MKNRFYLIFIVLFFGCEGDVDINPTEIGLANEESMPQGNLLAWYPFNGNANDLSGNDYHGIVYGATLSQDRLNGNNRAYYFNNYTSDFPENIKYDEERIEVDLNTESISTEMTIAWWFLNEGEGTISPRPFEFWVPGDGNGKLVIAYPHVNPNQEIIFEHVINGESLFYSFPYGNNNKWAHYAYTIGNGEAKFYKDGELIYTEYIDTSSVLLGEDVAFGRMNHPAWDAFRGKLDDIVIYSRVLDNDEIKYFYNLTHSESYL